MGMQLGCTMMTELPGPPPFDAASRFVREEDVAGSIACGDDVDAVLEAAKEYADAGFTHLALVQIGGTSSCPTSSGRRGPCCRPGATRSGPDVPLSVQTRTTLE